MSERPTALLEVLDRFERFVTPREHAALAMLRRQASRLESQQARIIELEADNTELVAEALKNAVLVQAQAISLTKLEADREASKETHTDEDFDKEFFAKEFTGTDG